VRNRWKFTCVFVVAAQLASATVAQLVLTESGTISGTHANGLSNPWTERLRCRLLGGAWQALCRTIIFCRLGTAKRPSVLELQM